MGKSATLNLTGSPQSILAAPSGKTLTVITIVVTNSGESSAEVNAELYRSGVAYEMVTRLAIPAKKTESIFSNKDLCVYLKAGDQIRMSANQNDVTAMCSYEEDVSSTPSNLTIVPVVNKSSSDGFITRSINGAYNQVYIPASLNWDNPGDQILKCEIEMLEISSLGYEGNGRWERFSIPNLPFNSGACDPVPLEDYLARAIENDIIGLRILECWQTEGATCEIFFRVCCLKPDGTRQCSEPVRFRLGDPCGAGTDEKGNCTLPEGCCGAWWMDPVTLRIYCKYPDYAGRPECCRQGVCPGDVGSGGGQGEPCATCGEWNVQTENGTKKAECVDNCQIRPPAPQESLYPAPKPNPTPAQHIFYNHIMNSVSNRLEGKTAFIDFPSGQINKNDMNLFSQHTFANTTGGNTIIRNGNCWINGVENISCVSAMQLSGFNPYVRPCTLLTRKHAVFCAHAGCAWPLNPEDRDGDVPYVFVDDQDNQTTVILKRLKYVEGSDDLLIGEFEEELPNTIKPAYVLPKNFHEYIIVPENWINMNYSPYCISLHQDWNVSLRNFSRGGTGVIWNHGLFGHIHFNLRGEIPGDSGFPSFLILEDKLVALGVWRYGELITSIVNNYDAINSTIEELSPGEGYSLNPINLDQVLANLISSGESSNLDPKFAISGCTNYLSPNFNVYSTCDDGSCLTCCNQGLCVANDQDANNNCNTFEAGTYIQPNNGCCDAFCLLNGDCAGSFASSFEATSCDGSTIEYRSCLDCSYQNMGLGIGII